MPATRSNGVSRESNPNLISTTPMAILRDSDELHQEELDSHQQLSNSITEVHVRIESIESGLSSMESGLVSVQSELQNLAEAKRYESATMNKLGSQMASIQTQIKLLADSLPQHVSPILNGAPSHQPRYVPPPRRIDQVRQLSSEHRRSSRSAPALRENILKPIDMPVFNGAYPYGWIMRLERFFRIGNISEEKKLGLVSLCFEGDALIWFNEQKNQDSFATWHEFKFRFYARFGSIKNRTELTLTKGSLYSKNEVHETVLSQTTQTIIEADSVQRKESFEAELISASKSIKTECVEGQNGVKGSDSIQESKDPLLETEIIHPQGNNSALGHVREVSLVQTIETPLVAHFGEESWVHSYTTVEETVKVLKSDEMSQRVTENKFLRSAHQFLIEIPHLGNPVKQLLKTPKFPKSWHFKFKNRSQTRDSRHETLLFHNKIAADDNNQDIEDAFLESEKLGKLCVHWNCSWKNCFLQVETPVKFLIGEGDTKTFHQLSDSNLDGSKHPMIISMFAYKAAKSQLVSDLLRMSLISFQSSNGSVFLSIISGPIVATNGKDIGCLGFRITVITKWIYEVRICNEELLRDRVRAMLLQLQNHWNKVHHVLQKISVGYSLAVQQDKEQNTVITRRDVMQFLQHIWLKQWLLDTIFQQITQDHSAWEYYQGEISTVWDHFIFQERGELQTQMQEPLLLQDPAILLFHITGTQLQNQQREKKRKHYKTWMFKYKQRPN